MKKNNRKATAATSTTNANRNDLAYWRHEAEKYMGVAEHISALLTDPLTPERVRGDLGDFVDEISSVPGIDSRPRRIALALATHADRKARRAS